MAAAAMRNFNTLKSFDRLKKVGVSEEQAREFVALFEESVNASMENLMTKSDLQTVHVELNGEIQDVRTELKVEIQAVRAEMQEMRAELKAETQELRLEVKTDIAELRQEMMHKFSEQDKKISVLDTAMVLMQRLFFGGTLLVLLSIAGLYFHH